MPFECPECHGNKTLKGAIFETCADCGYCSVDREQHTKMLLARINDMEAETAKMVGWNNRLVDENGKLLVRLKALEGVVEDMERLWGRHEQLEAENARLTAALVECQEAFDSGRDVGERAGYGELEY